MPCFNCHSTQWCSWFFRRFSSVPGLSLPWRCRESSRLYWPTGQENLPRWPRFDSWTRRHICFEFVVGSLLCSERFFSGYSGFPLYSKTNIFIFQFDPGMHGHFKRVLVNSRSPWVNKLHFYIFTVLMDCLIKGVGSNFLTCLIWVTSQQIYHNCTSKQLFFGKHPEYNYFFKEPSVHPLLTMILDDSGVINGAEKINSANIETEKIQKVNFWRNLRRIYFLPAHLTAPGSQRIIVNNRKMIITGLTFN